MGDIADMMLEGILCNSCGELMPDFCGDGEITEELIPYYPRWCDDKDCQEIKKAVENDT